MLYDNRTSFKYGEVMPNYCYRIDTDIPGRGLFYLKNGIPSSAGMTNFPALEKITSLAVQNIKALRVFKYKMNKKDTNLFGLIFLFTNSKLYILRQDNFNKLHEIENNYSVDEINDKLSITQFENSLIICCENKKPFMVRVNESDLTFSVVDYWESITNPPVKGVSPEFVYTEDDKQIYEWYKKGTKIIFKSTVGKVYATKFIEKLPKGRISFYGGEFYIDKIEDIENTQMFTTTQMIAPEIETPLENATVDDKKINILDIRFSENLFKDNGYPAVCCYYGGRIIFGNVAGNPSAIVSSRVNDSINFRSSLDDNDGFTTFIPDNELNTVKALIPHKSLLALTDKGVYSTLLNTVLTPRESMFFQMPTPTPKGTAGTYIKHQGALYYVDTSDRVNKFDDIGEENTYKSHEISIYSQHLTKQAKKIYATEFQTNNFVGVDTGEENNIFIHNQQTDISAWTRVNKLPGLVEYSEIDNLLYQFHVNDSGIDIYTYSKDKVEPMELKIPFISINIGPKAILTFNNKATVGRVIINCFGNPDFQINNHKKTAPFNNQDGYYKLKPIEISNVGGEELTIKQLDNTKIEILSITTEIKGLQEVK